MNYQKFFDDHQRHKLYKKLNEQKEYLKLMSEYDKRYNILYEFSTGVPVADLRFLSKVMEIESLIVLAAQGQFDVVKSRISFININNLIYWDNGLLDLVEHNRFLPLL